MAELLTLDLNTVSDTDVSCWMDEMDEESRARMDTMTSPKRRREALAGDHLARTALAKQSGKMPCEIVIRRTEKGKPYAAEGFFSISHSGDQVVCALSGKNVGVDIEKIRTAPHRVVKRYFTDGEQRLYENDPEQFWHIWTGKEALCKLSGEGLAILKECDTTCPPEGVRLTVLTRDGYVIAVAELD